MATQKYDPSQITDALGLMVEGLSLRKISEAIGINRATLGEIRNGIAYANVTKDHPLMRKLQEKEVEEVIPTESTSGKPLTYDPIYSRWQNRRFRGSDEGNT